MNKPVYIWYTEIHDFSSLSSGFKFVSETLEAGEREFAKRHSDFAVYSKETNCYSYTDDDGEHLLVWAIKRNMIIKEEES